MARLARNEVFKPEDTSIVHVMNRTVRGAWLIGEDQTSGKDFSHRRTWVEDELVRSSSGFGIDLLTYAIMSNHFHLILRSRPDVVEEWNDHEVARRWLILCPKRKNKDGTAKEPSERDIEALRASATKMKQIRRRLSDISWWMRLMCQRIAQRANAEDGGRGKFWENRFQAVRILDEESLLACAAYVDLNPIRAAMAQTIESSSYTSIKTRLSQLKTQLASELESQLESQASQLAAQLASLSAEELQAAVQQQQPQDPEQRAAVMAAQRVEAATASAAALVTDVSPITVGGFGPGDGTAAGNKFSQMKIVQGVMGFARLNLERLNKPRLNDGFLAPVLLDSRYTDKDPLPSADKQRASDRGFLNMSLASYAELLDWSARQMRSGKPGATPESMPPILERLKIDADIWHELVTGFGEMFSLVAGLPEKVDSTKSSTNRSYYMKRRTRELLSRIQSSPPGTDPAQAPGLA